MKIGILTYHRTDNYGACLQALATRFVLEELGHEAYYIDYWPDYHADIYKLFSWNSLKRYNIKGKINYLLNSFSNLTEKKQRKNNFDDFHTKYIIPYCRPITETFDAILYGSDQIWRKQAALGNYNPVYFGQNDFNTSNHIAFAASMGKLPLTLEDKNKVRELLSKLNHIAVREDNLKSLLEELGYKNVERIVDPTLLLSGKEWSEKLGLKKYKGNPYLLVYYITKPAFDMKQIERIAKEEGLEIKILCGSAKNKRKKNIYSTVDPIQFLNLLKNAKYTFVSSFHGLAFSIIFQREFYASYFTNSNRAETLLETIGISNRLLPPKVNLRLNEDEVDFHSVECVLSMERERAITLLKRYLEMK